MSCTGPSPTPCYQLQKEEVRSHQPTPTKEEAKVNGSLIWRLGNRGENGRREWSVEDGFFAGMVGCICPNNMSTQWNNDQDMHGSILLVHLKVTNKYNA